MVERPGWITQPQNTYFGPVETGKRLCIEGNPVTLEECGFLEDLSEWICEQVRVEPKWRIDQDNELNGSRWCVWIDRGHPYDRANGQRWYSENRARDYLQMLIDDWWGLED